MYQPAPRCQSGPVQDVVAVERCGRLPAQLETRGGLRRPSFRRPEAGRSDLWRGTFSDRYNARVLDLLARLRRRFRATSYATRIANELENFSSQIRGRESGDAVERFAAAIPAFDYAMQLCNPYVVERMPNIDVLGYMHRRAADLGRTVRVVSLGCGTGDWEFAGARQTGGEVAFDLVDINEHLMSAATRLSQAEGLPISTIVADVNRIDLPARAYDFVLCRSSLHHFLELERLFEQIRRTLVPGGEFVVIGEWVGRNGLQLYPETERVAQKIFDTLPERLRLSSYTGRIDHVVPNEDHSVNSFEAVRSEDIMPLLLKSFTPREYVTFDAYISLLLDFRYGRNYNLDSPEDKEWVERIAAGDLDHIRAGTLKPTAMFGIYGC